MLKLIRRLQAENKIAKADPRSNKKGNGKQAPSLVRFSQLYDLVSDGVMLVDVDYNVLYVNRMFANLAAPGSEVCFGDKCYHSFTNRLCKTDCCPLRHLRSGGQETAYSVLVRKCIDGRMRSGTMTVRPIIGSKRRMVGMISVFKDTTELREARQALQSVKTLLDRESKSLDSKRTALKEVLLQLEDERREMQLRIQANLDRSVLPVVKKLAGRLNSSERFLLEEIEDRLENILSPFVNNLSRQSARLTPREIEICNLIKHGLSSKEIAARINVSEQTVFKQRRNIRKKLRIADGETNLCTYLQGFQDIY